MFNLGTMCALGQGAEQDVAAAAEWYKLAAEKGLPGAQFAYANYLLTGQGVEKEICWTATAPSSKLAEAPVCEPHHSRRRHRIARLDGLV